MKLSENKIKKIIEWHVRDVLLNESRLNNKLKNFLRSDKTNMAGIGRELMRQGVIETDDENTMRSVLSKWSRNKISTPKKVIKAINKIKSESNTHSSNSISQTYLAERDILKLPNNKIPNIPNQKTNTEEDFYTPQEQDVEQEIETTDDEITPEIKEIIDILNEHPDKIETTLKYLKGITGL